MGLSTKKIQLLREFVDFKCEECHKPEKEVGKLQPHRIIRGSKGGKYELRNIKMVCKPCHKLYHGREFL
jgi:hypothetical protein